MTQLVHFNRSIDKFLLYVRNELDVALEVMKDTNWTLDDRWEIYLKVEKLLPINKYLSKASKILTDSPYDDLFPDGRGFLFNSDLDESIVENYESWKETPIGDNRYGDETYRQHANEMYAKRDAWREAVLEEGIAGFAFDW